MAHYYYMHKDDGYLVTYDTMTQICQDEYDVGDPTNPATWEDYFIRTDIVVDG